MSVALCYNWQGEAVTVAADALKPRPAVYGVFIENSRAFLLQHSETNLYYPPGGMLEAHERPSDALRHFFRQVTGIMPLVGALLYTEDRYYVDEQGYPWQLTVMYYDLQRPSTLMAALPEWESELHPEFVPLETLKRQQMLFGFDAIQAARLHHHQ